MNDKITNYIDTLLGKVPDSRRKQEFKEELSGNLYDRYTDLLAQGKSEDEAYSLAINSIGDADELIKGLTGPDVFSPRELQQQRERSAVLVSIAVGLFILSFGFPVFFSQMFPRIDFVGILCMFVCWAAGTMLLVYNSMSKPRYIKKDETIVEEFKEWTVDKKKSKTVIRTIHAMIWVVALMVFLCLGFFFHAFHPGWMVFLLAIIGNCIVNLLYTYREAGKGE